MGCINSKVDASEISPANPRKTRHRNFLMRGVNNVFFRKNRVVPGTVTTPTTSGSYDVFFRRRFFAANPQTSDNEDSSEGEMTSPLNKEGEHDKRYDILVIDHCDTEEEREDSDHMSMINVKERLGGVAFELMDDDETAVCLPEKSPVVYPMERINDTRSSKGGVAFDIDFTDDAAEKSSFYPMARMNDTRSSKGGVAFDIDFNDHADDAAEKSSVYPVARMNDTRSSKGGVAFDIDFTDDAAEKRTLTTISKVASIMARDGWSERDVIKEADDVWVANKVLTVKDNVRRSQEWLAAREKAELDFDMITATMTDDDLQDFYFIGMKETSTERSLLRQTFYRAWLAKLRA